MDMHRRGFLSMMACGTALAPRVLSEHSSGTDSLDAEYRKLDDLASFLRNRNAQQFPIGSSKAPTNPRLSRSAESSSGSRFAGRAATIPRCSFCTAGPVT